MSEETDYLLAMDRNFSTVGDFVDYLEKDFSIGSMPGEFNIFGAVNNLPSKQEFTDSITAAFDTIDSTGNLYLITTTVENERVYYYVYMDEDFPIFFTRANKTDQIPPTIGAFLQNKFNVGRLMLSQRQIDELRKELVSDYEDLLIPFFSAKRTPDSNISARRRPNTTRSLQYRADDGLETYREMRFNYGVLPRIMTFERPNHFKFRVKQDGIFVHQSGSILELWNSLQEQIDRAENIVEYSNTGGYGEVTSSFFEDKQIRVSSPWGIEVQDGIQSAALDNFRQHMDDGFWEFGVSEYHARPEIPSFEAEIIDENRYERTILRTKDDTIRVFPRELTDIDQSVRIFNFVSDHFDSDCVAREVA
jgi:hypothetical protein